MKPRFNVTMAYEIVTPESARRGEVDEAGFVFRDEPMSLFDTADLLRTCVEVSCWPVRGPEDLTGREWASTEPESDWDTGAVERQSIHVSRIDRDTTGLDLWRLFRLAGLVNTTSRQELLR